MDTAYEVADYQTSWYSIIEFNRKHYLFRNVKCKGSIYCITENFFKLSVYCNFFNTNIKYITTYSFVSVNI